MGARAQGGGIRNAWRAYLDVRWDRKLPSCCQPDRYTEKRRDKGRPRRGVYMAVAGGGLRRKARMDCGQG
jgi:hypothetical protein